MPRWIVTSRPKWKPVLNAFCHHLRRPVPGRRDLL